jgi:hypothetical protein
MMTDLFSSIEIRRLLSPDEGAGSNTARVSEIIDTANYTQLVFAVMTGALADADATFAVLVEYGDDSGLSDAAAVPDDYLIGTEAGAGLTFADDDEVRKIGYIGPKRYVRLTVTPANNTGAWDVGALAILGRPRKGPRSSQT